LFFSFYEFYNLDKDRRFPRFLGLPSLGLKAKAREAKETRLGKIGNEKEPL